MSTPNRPALVTAVRRLAVVHRDQLEELKQGARDLDRPDFVWHFLLQAYSTWGSSLGWEGLIHTPENYARVTWAALLPLTRAERIVQAEDTFRAAKMRYAANKARYLADNFERIQGWGGLQAARERLFSAEGAAGKLRFWKSLSGIGPKYARNVMMDVYHPDFHDSIAIDQRIKRVLEAVGAPDGPYGEQEEWLLEVARDAGLNGWELDRLLYHHRDAVLDALRAPGAPVGDGEGPNDVLIELRELLRMGKVDAALQRIEAALGR